MNMLKTYKFIVINKSNMSELRHFAKAESVADLLYPEFKIENWIIIKNENIVVNLAEINFIGGGAVDRRKWMVFNLEKA